MEYAAVVALSENARMGLIGVSATAAALFLFRGGGPSASPSDPLRLMPKGSFLVGSLDAAELRKSPIYEALLGRDAMLAPLLGAGALQEACGFDPISRVTRMAVGVPEEERGEIGFAAKVEVTREELEKCSKALTAKRGGQPETKEVGSFIVLSDATAEAKSRIAYGTGGLLVIGKGKWFDTMLATGEGKHPSVEGDEKHAKLRSTITGREGWRAPTLVATAILPSSLRARLKTEMAEEADGAGGIMSGVLGVSAVGVGLKAGAAGRPVELSIELDCDSPEACETVDKLIQKKRLDLSRDLALRMVGFGPVIDSLQTQRQGAHVRVTASADAEALAGSVERAMRFRGRQNERPTRPSRDNLVPFGGGGDKSDAGFTVRAPKQGSSSSSSSGSGAHDVETPSDGGTR